MASTYDFNFLRPYWPKLAAIANDAARLQEVSPVASVTSCQTFCAWAADRALEICELQLSYDATQMEKLDALKISGATPADILQRFHNVRTANSRARHPLGDRDVSRTCVADIAEIAQWLVSISGGHVSGSITRSEPVAAKSASARKEPRKPRTAPVYLPEDDVDAPVSAPVGGRRDDRIDDDDFEDEDDRPAFLGKGRFPWYLVIAGVVLIALLLVLVFSLKSCSGEPSAVPSATPTMVPTIAVEVTPSPTPVPEAMTTYLDALVPSVAFDTFYRGQWTANSYTGAFDINSRLYTHGVGMFLRSSQMSEGQGSDTITYALGGAFTKMTFDLGVDSVWSNGDEATKGTFRVLIYLDDNTEPAYDSGFKNNTFEQQGIEVDLTGAQTMRIRLMQTRGSDGTLNVILGDAVLTQAEGAAIPTPTPTPAVFSTLAPSATPAP